ncbi:hypothetical protein BC829DRAFT_494894 [Chytridium lagenaria]|nr:hypothetical protein BC829DRAFT_494894 [Chytridium lagenaria]
MAAHPSTPCHLVKPQSGCLKQKAAMGAQGSSSLAVSFSLGLVGYIPPLMIPEPVIDAAGSRKARRLSALPNRQETIWCRYWFRSKHQIVSWRSGRAESLLAFLLWHLLERDDLVASQAGTGLPVKFSLWPVTLPVHLRVKYQTFFNFYIMVGAVNEVNISFPVRKKLLDKAQTGDGMLGDFDEAKEEIVLNMFYNTYPRWLETREAQINSKVRKNSSQEKTSFDAPVHITIDPAIEKSAPVE